MKIPYSSLSSRLSDADIGRILVRNSAVITGGHFVYSKPKDHGDHGPNYVNKDALYADPDSVADLCLEIAWRMRDFKVDHDNTVIIGPAMGGVILSNQVAFFHNQIRAARMPSVFPAQAAFAEKKQGGGFEFRRGYDQLIAGKDVIVLEDIVNSGGSVAEVVTAVRETGGNPLGVFAICNRGRVTADMIGVPFLNSLISFKFDKYPESECPLCDAGVPVREDLGHGRDFIRRQRQQP